MARFGATPLGRASYGVVGRVGVWQGGVGYGLVRLGAVGSGRVGSTISWGPMQRGLLYLTSLEIEVRDALDRAGILYIPQYPTRTGFILDFAIPARHIAIEADGPLHDTPDARKRDAFRTHRLRQEGWKVLRIHWSEDVQKAVDELLLAS